MHSTVLDIRVWLSHEGCDDIVLDRGRDGGVPLIDVLAIPN